MALVYFDGFQDCATARKPEWVAGSNNFTNQPGRDGSTNGAAGSMNNSAFLPFTLGNATLLTGFGFWFSDVQLGQTATVHSYANGTTYLLHMGITATGFLEFRRGSDFNSGVRVGLSSGHAPLQISRWYHIQIKYVAHLTSGTLAVQLDGAVVVNLTGVQTANNTLTPDRFYHNTFSNFGGNQWRYDDLWIADSTDGTALQGQANNDFLGDLKVTTLIPTGNGDLTDWSKSTGTVAATLVDEVPPNTTDYIFSATSAQRELMALPDLTTRAGPVYGVRVNLYALKTDAGASSVKPLLKESGGTITAQAALPLSTTAAPYAGPILWTKPSAPTVAWAAADVNGLQAGVELA